MSQNATSGPAWRLLGVVSERPTTLGSILSLAEGTATIPSRPFDGRGVALWIGNIWRVHRTLATSGKDPAFDDALGSACGEVIVAHNGLRSVGRARIANTHPFCRDGWAFAHVGTIEDLDHLRSRTSVRRAREPYGHTDSELLFACLLNCFDVAGDRRDEIDIALGCCVRELASASPASGLTFLLSDGMALYAYRRGQPLFLLERPATTLIASAPLTSEAWMPMAEGDLVRISREGRPSIRKLASTLAPAASSGPELPFTD